MLGSPEKDLKASSEGKVIGAYVDCGPEAVKNGVCAAGFAAAKRLSLSFTTLQKCALPYTTVSLRRCVVGAWVSTLLFRRRMMSLLNEAFTFVEAFEEDDDSSFALTSIGSV